MGDEEGGALSGHFQQVGREGVGGGRVEVGCRLVENQDTGKSARSARARATRRR